MIAMNYLKKLTLLAVLITFLGSGSAFQQQEDPRKSLEKTTEAIRAAFGREDIPAILALHHPDVIKAFGPNIYINGRTALEKSLRDNFKANKLSFLENRVQSILFNGETAVETSIFTIQVSPKNGDKPFISKGRAMVVYVRHKESPTGWASIREMTQGVGADE
jgi:ketosteroid isomerase-like protein